MKWTTNRPTEPGDYWLAIHPDQRGALYDEGVYKVVLRHGEGKVWQAGCLATIPEERLAGAQWAPRETPADPFAPAADPLHPTGRCTCCGDGTCAWCKDAEVREDTEPAAVPTVSEITELNLPHDRGYMTIEDDGERIKAIIRPDLGGGASTDRLRWLRAAVVAAGEYLGKLCDKGQGVTVVSREMAAYEAYLAGRITREQYLATDPRDVVVPIATALPSWRAELERLRGMVRERQCLAGEELQRLTKLEELDALRSGVVGRNTHLLIPDEVAECMRIRGGSHHPSGHWRLDAEFGEWECEDPTGYTARSEYILTAIDAAGAAVLAGEG